MSQKEHENQQEKEIEQTAEEICTEENPITILEEKLANSEEKYLRIAAEYDNYKRRTIREKEAIYSDAVAYTIKEILPILDSLDMAANAAKDAGEDTSVAEGISMIANMTAAALTKLGVDAIETKDVEFDANLHDAVMHIDDDAYGINMVVEELCKGYRYGDKVIRHSMVKVAN